MKKSGLGKGLDALFAANKIEETTEGNVEEIVQEIKLINIEPNKGQPRRVFNEEQISELSESIKKHGVIQPIIVTNKGGYYQIVAGERRWRASKIAGLATIPAIIREDDERKNQEIALIENIQREDLNPLEKAVGVKQLMTDYNLTQQEVADILGKSRSGIANTVRLLNLDERVKEFVLQGKLTEGHCKTLLSEEDKEKQYNMAINIINTEGSVRDLERKLQNSNIAKEKKDNKYEAIFKDIENSFQNFFGAKVKLNAGKRCGKIVIQYSNNDDLERILELIKQ